MAISPEDLFLNIWSHAISDEENIKPGTEEWDKYRKRIHIQWCKTWNDCVNLSRHLDNYNDLLKELKSAPQGDEDDEDEESDAEDLVDE
jgi:hypothetical protein